jgi:hypothetical protein
MITASLRSVFILSLVGLAACAQLPGIASGAGPAVRPPVPEITVSQITLEARPSNQRLAAYYCNEATGGGLAGLACRVFGDLPRKTDLQFTFRVELAAKNPSPTPMPVVAAMVAFTAYPEATGGQNLGSVCVQMCEDPNNCPQAADACNSTEPQIRGMQDFATAAAGFLISTALNGGPRESLRIPMVPAGGTVTFVAGLSLNADQMLGLIKRVSGDVVSQVKTGKQPTFIIPWAVEGSAWVTFEGFGRIGAGFPRQTGSWDLAAELP